MQYRQAREQWEREHLSPYAFLSADSAGRREALEECPMRTCFCRDRDRIIHSKAFRRLKHKTQVFLSPVGDHYRTRLIHTLEVSQISRDIARALRLNEDLTEAIALGHDLGHTPFGHAGERILNDLCPFEFHHNEQSVRTCEKIERLNLCAEVLDGILNHTGSGHPATLEGKIVRLSDKIAYINHDIDDAIRGRIITEKELPDRYTDVLGHDSKERLNTLIHDVIDNSMDQPDILMSSHVEEAMLGMRRYMFDHVYTNPKAKNQETKAQNLLRELYEYYMKYTEQMPEEYRRLITDGRCSRERAVCDYLSGMTDQYTIETYEELYIPKAWKIY